MIPSQSPVSTAKNPPITAGGLIGGSGDDGGHLNRTTRGLEAEDTERKRRDGITKPKFYACPKCRHIQESFDYIDQCPACKWEGELFTASTEERAQKTLDAPKPAHAREEELEATQRIQIAQSLANRMGFRQAAREILKEHPIYYDQNKLWWQWDHNTRRWKQIDETDILLIAQDALNLFGDTTIKSRNEILEALRQEGRKKQPADLPPEWVQFGTSLYNIQTGEEKDSTSDYFSTNPIPWRLGETSETPTIDRLFTAWVGDNAPALYEIVAYSCYRDYPIHSIFTLNGSGRNGKTTFMRLLGKFLGAENIASTDLERLQDNRFETFNLYRKLLAQMGETNLAVLKNTSLLKRLTGQDLIPFEAKGKGSFTGTNYAKIVIATNSLPSSDDESEGYFRRWIIIDFPKNFQEGKDILQEVPDTEYEALARRCALMLDGLIKRGSFTNQGSIEERTERYIAASNPLVNFIREECSTDDPEAFIRKSEFYLKYVGWLKDRKRRVVKPKEFTTALEHAGFEIRNTTISRGPGEPFDKDRFIYGLKWSFKPVTQVTQVTHVFPLSSPYIEPESEIKRNPRNPRIAPINAVFENRISEKLTNDVTVSTEYPVPYPPSNLSEYERFLLMARAAGEVVLGDLAPNSKISGMARTAKERGDLFESRPGVLRPNRGGE